MTNQEAYNAVWRHFVTEGNPPSIADNGFCFYRLSRKGRLLRCAIGILIPDDLYSPALENTSLWTLVRQDDRIAKHLCGVDIDLMNRMQRAHDGAASRSSRSSRQASPFVALFEDTMRAIASEYHLTVPGTVTG